jgi:3-oxoacyl-[acyl-carrier protein] reductase
VAPGPIETDITAETDPSMLTKIIAAVPMRRIGRAEEVSHIVCMLLADQASFTTGTVIGVDGGLSM